MKHIGLFEGLGGFSLAARWIGWETVAWCEWNEFCQKVLKHNFPGALGYGDIAKTDFTKYAHTIDILTGGFPCQPYSVAGKRKGKEDERHLWPEMLRAIREISPRWIVGENVLGIINWGGEWSSMRCRLTWKLKGTRSCRMYFQLVPKTHITEGIGCGLLPTPAKADTWNYQLPPRKAAKGSHSRALPEYLRTEAGIMHCTAIAEILMGYPENWIPSELLETQ